MSDTTQPSAPFNDAAPPKQFSSPWWQDRKNAMRWCHEFCEPFYKEDPTLLQNPDVHQTIAIVLFNKPDGTTVPVGMTARNGADFIFQYHPSYLADPSLPPISANLPKQKERFTTEDGLHPFFDNILAEGWFGSAQGHAIGVDPKRISDDMENLGERYHRMLMFGRDCPGAVWATYIRVDPNIGPPAVLHQETIQAALQSRSTIPGKQPKLLGVEMDGKLRPANYGETSTHIIKLPKDTMPGIMEYEYMSTVATKALLPGVPVMDANLTRLHLRNGKEREVLAIKRFDRTPQGGRVHFEEINQILNKPNSDRYNGSYADIAHCVGERMGKEGVKQFYARLLTQFLLGNVDNHFKNFAMFHDHATDKWSMTPEYDLAPTVNYHKSTLALFSTPYRVQDPFTTKAESKEQYSELNPKILVKMGQEFGLGIPEIKDVIEGIKANIPAARQAVMNDPNPRLDEPVPASSSHEKKLQSRNMYRPSPDHPTFKQDFCRRMDGRADQLFGTLKRYLEYLEQKGGSEHQR